MRWLEKVCSCFLVVGAGYPVGSSDDRQLVRRPLAKADKSGDSWAKGLPASSKDDDYEPKRRRRRKWGKPAEPSALVSEATRTSAVQNIALCFVRAVKRIEYKHEGLLTALDVLRYAIQGSQVFKQDRQEDVAGSLETLETFLCGSVAFTAVLSEGEIRCLFKCITGNPEAWQVNYRRDDAKALGHTIRKRLGWFRKQPAYKARRAVRLIANDEYVKREARVTPSAASFLQYVFEHCKDDEPKHPLSVTELDDAYVDAVVRERTLALDQTIAFMRLFLDRLEDAIAGQPKVTEGESEVKAQSEAVALCLQSLLGTLRLNLQETSQARVMEAFALTAEACVETLPPALQAFFQSADAAFMTACAGEVFLRNPRVRAVFSQLIDVLIGVGAQAFTAKRNLVQMRAMLEYVPRLVRRTNPVNPYGLFVSMLGPAIIDAQSPPVATQITRLLSKILPYIDVSSDARSQPGRTKTYGLMLLEFCRLLGFGEGADMTCSLMRYIAIPQKHALPVGAVRALLEAHPEMYAHLVEFCSGNEWDLAEYMSLSYEALTAIPDEAYHAEINALAEVFEGFARMDPETLGVLLVRLAMDPEAEMQVSLTLRLAKYRARFTDWLWFGQITAEDDLRRLASTLDSASVHKARRHQ